MDRRQFIQSLGRKSILAILIGISGILLLRKNNKEDDCNYDFACKNCKSLKSCDLKEAVEYKIKRRTK